jgi:hypothetical protein
VTRDEVVSLTYLLPRMDGHPDRLRAVLPYDPLPPQEAFEGPISPNSLGRRYSEIRDINMDYQQMLREKHTNKTGLAAQVERHTLHEEGLAKALPLADAGWEVFVYDIFLAVLVEPEG